MVGLPDSSLYRHAAEQNRCYHFGNAWMEPKHFTQNSGLSVQPEHWQRLTLNSNTLSLSTQWPEHSNKKHDSSSISCCAMKAHYTVLLTVAWLNEFLVVVKFDSLSSVLFLSL